MSEPSENPSVEPAPATPELLERARGAVAALRGRGRDARGQAGPGNTLNLRHGLRSAQLAALPDLATWQAEQAAAITSDLGGDAELTALARASVREVARLEVILAALGDQLLEGGVLTGKGRMRAATTVYLQVLDRFTRLSATLGLQRRPKPLTTIQEFIKSRDTSGPDDRS